MFSNLAQYINTIIAYFDVPRRGVDGSEGIPADAVKQALIDAGTWVDERATAAEENAATSATTATTKASEAATSAMNAADSAATAQDALTNINTGLVTKLTLVTYPTYALAVIGLNARPTDCFVKITADEVQNAGELSVYYYDATSKRLSGFLDLGWTSIL